MTTATLELSMPEVNIAEGAGLWGTIAAGVTAAVAILYTLWGNLRKSGQAAETETDALKMVSAAVEHWKGLYEVAWEQVKKEREMRMSAELRAQTAVEEVEGLRSEVATLRREIERLTAMVSTMQGTR